MVQDGSLDELQGDVYLSKKQSDILFKLLPSHVVVNLTQNWFYEEETTATSQQTQANKV